MSPEIEALARRAVACVEISRWPDWTPVSVWGPGEDPYEYHGYLDTEEGSPVVVTFCFTTHRKAYKTLPMLDTPAGIGCLLALVREAWPGWHVQVIAYADDTPAEVEVAKGYDAIPFMDDTVAAALILALEAAP